MRAYASILLIPVNRFQFCSYRESSFVWKSINMTEKSSRKAAGIDKVNILNLGLRKTKHESTAPQKISIYRTRSVKNTNIAHRRVLDHRNTANWDFIHRITAVKKHQHRKSSCPPFLPEHEFYLLTNGLLLDSNLLTVLLSAGVKGFNWKVNLFCLSKILGWFKLLMIIGSNVYSSCIEFVIRIINLYFHVQVFF